MPDFPIEPSLAIAVTAIRPAIVLAPQVSSAGPDPGAEAGDVVQFSVSFDGRDLPEADRLAVGW